MLDKDKIISYLKVLITIIVSLILIWFDYRLGVKFCILNNIPKDFSITMISPGMAINICIVLFVFEVGFIYQIKELIIRHRNENI